MKNVKRFLRLSGCFLLSAMFLFSFGNGMLRAQDTYTKITSADELTDGTYLIVCEEAGMVGALSDYNGIGCNTAAVTISNNSISCTPASVAGASTPHDLTLKKGNNGMWTIYDVVENYYLAFPNVKNKMSTSTDAYDWEIKIEAGKHQIIATTKATASADKDKVFEIQRNTTASQAYPFRCYAATQKTVALYKKQGTGTESACNPVSNVQESVTESSVTLTWRAPSPRPANGYKITIYNEDTEEVKTDTVEETTYTYSGLAQSSEYMYEIVSLCSETSFSESVDGTFETLDPNAKTLNVTIAGEMEGNNYTGSVTFTFVTTNFILGTDGKLKYEVLGDESEIDTTATTTSTTLTLDLPADYYYATFTLVDMSGADLEPSVKVEKEFTVKRSTGDDPGSESDLGVLFYEPFDKVKGTSDISAKMDANTEMPGWTASNVYGNDGSVRVGTGKNAGSLQTPAIDLSTNDGNFILTFDAKAWNSNEAVKTFNLTVGDKTVPVELTAEMQPYEFDFDNGTATTKIKFEGTGANNRFILDNIKIKEGQVGVANLTVLPDMFELKTVQGNPVSQKVTVKGRNLENDVTVTCLQAHENFRVSAVSLTKEAVMGTNGAELTVTFNASVAADSAKIELESGDLHETIMVRAFATSVEEVDNIAAFRAGTQGTVYKIKGQAVVTAIDGVSIWAQDATGAILIYDNQKVSSTQYAVGDGIVGLYGELAAYKGLLELVPTGNLPQSSTHGNPVEPQVMTVQELNEKGVEYSSRLVKINGLALSEAEGVWKKSTNYTAFDEDENEIIIRTLSGGSLIGEEQPEDIFDMVALVGYYDETVQLSPRVKEDIIAAGGGDDEDCQAPTGLTYSGSTKITVKWNGSANEYKLALLSKDGKDTVFTKLLSATEYTFGEEVKPNVEYGWAVASVCENGKLVWAKGKNFQIETANEDLELQAEVYPNPTDGVVYIKVADNARMEIFTLGGIVLRSEELVAGRNEIRLDRSGIYFIRLTNGTATTVRRVVVR